MGPVSTLSPESCKEPRLTRRSRSLDRTDAAAACMDLARAAAALARVPYASVRFQRGTRGSVGATYGLDHREDMVAAEAFASLALLHVDPLVIDDLASARGLPPDLQPNRTRLRWFGSLPVQTRDGAVVGVVCVFDLDGQPGERARLDDVAHLVHGLDVVGAVVGRARRRDPRSAAAGRCSSAGPPERSKAGSASTTTGRRSRVRPWTPPAGSRCRCR